MAGTITRIVPRDSLTTEKVVRILQRMCNLCMLDGFLGYFMQLTTEDVAFRFCEKCPFSARPTETITAFPLPEYLAWVYICELHDLAKVLEEQADHAEGLLMDKLLVFEQDGTTKKLRFAGLVPPDAPFPVPEHVENVQLQFPELPYVLHNDDGWIFKFPMELVYNSYPTSSK